MKKLSVLFLLPLFAFNFINDWQPVKLADQITVLFPVKPKESETSGYKMWVADLGGNRRCMAMVFDFGLMGMDSAQMARDYARPEAFEEFRNSILAEMKNTTVTKERDTVYHGFKTYEFELKMNSTLPAMDFMYNRNHFIGDKMIVLNYFEMNRTENSEVREKFFNSLKVK